MASDGSYLDAGSWLAARMTEPPKRRKAKLQQTPDKKGPDSLGANFRGPAAHGEAVRKAQKAEELVRRRLEAWRLFTKESKTIREIALLTGVAKSTAHADLIAVLKELQSDQYDNADLMRAGLSAKYEGIMSAHYGNRAKVNNARVLMQAMGGFSRLHGLDLRHEAAVPVDQVIGLVRGLVGIVLESTNDVPADVQQTVRQRVIQGIRRQIGPLASRTVIDVGGEDEGGDERQTA